MDVPSEFFLRGSELEAQRSVTPAKSLNVQIFHFLAQKVFYKRIALTEKRVETS